MKRNPYRLIAAALFIVFCSQTSAEAQQLPKNPDPNKCYVRTVTLDEYVYTFEDYLTYTPEEAARFPHQELELVISPKYSQWEATTYEGCESDDPNDCQVLCYKSYPAKIVIIYDPINDTLGSPHWVEVEFKELVNKGGLTSYEEIDCALTSFNNVPLSWDKEDITALTPQDKRMLDDRIVELLRQKENIRIQINVHTKTNGMAQELENIASDRAFSIIDHLENRFINTYRVLTRAWGGKQPLNKCGDPMPCSEWEDSQNERVQFRVLNMDH
ncbi:MAG: OmpA family protein [Lewinella sp.]